MPLQRIQLAADKVDGEQVAMASEAIAAGRSVVLPTETVYGLAVDPRQAARVQALRDLKGRSAEQAFTHHISAAEDAEEMLPPLSLRVRRLMENFWPGPLTLVLEDARGQSLGLRVPAQAFTQQVIHRFGHSIFMTSINPSGAPPLTDPDEIVARYGEDIDLLFDDGPSQLGLASTVLRCINPLFEVLREGSRPSEEILAAASELILFVCTGNTCRSPMAEGFARKEAARRLGIKPEQLLARGLRFASAGISAFSGSSASEGSLQAAAELGIDLSGHQSRSLSPTMIAEASRVYCLSSSHMAAILASVPQAAEKVQLLDAGREVPDPIGGDLLMYRSTRDHISRAVSARLPEIFNLVK
ncbi:MAG: Sua5/YciO/YrdC/YwlC family protein [Planctomycetota bacterium]|jgi:protein-tyrosine phosphatase